MSEALAALVGAFAGFLLAAAWDTFRVRRERRDRQRAALRAFAAEMAANRDLAGNHLTMLAIEQKDAEEGNAKVLVNSLRRLESGAWPIARSNLPRAVFDDVGLMGELTLIARITDDNNSNLANRDTFRIFHLTNDALVTEGLAKYQSLLDYQLRDLITRIESVRPRLEPLLD